MSTSIKYILPLISNELTLEDIGKDTGFVDAYTYDINKPQLDNHIFLMYKIDAGKRKSFFRNKRLSENKSLHSKYTYVIKDNSYIVYAFPISSKSIQNIKNGHLLFTDEDKLKIISFWKCTDANINDYTIHPLTTFCSYKPTSIPEQDFRLDINYKQKSRGLSI